MSDNLFKLVENSLVQLIQPLVEGVNFYYSTDNVKVIRPALVIVAGNAKEQMGPFTGVFDVGVTMTYSAKLDDTTTILASAKFQEILQSLYYNTSLASRLNAIIAGNFYVHGVPRISFQELPPDETERLWIKTIDLRVICMPRTNT